MKTFDYLGMAHRTSSRRYEAGPAIQVMAIQRLVGSGFLTHSLPVLERLHKYHLITALGTLWQDTVTYLYHHHPGMSVAESVGSLQLFPATQSSIGIMLLSEYHDGEVQALYAAREILGYPGVDDLLHELELARHNGFVCLTDIDRRSIAVKIGAPAWSAIAISGDIPENKVSDFVQILRDATREIEVNKDTEN